MLCCENKGYQVKTHIIRKKYNVFDKINNTVTQVDTWPELRQFLPKKKYTANAIYMYTNGSSWMT